MAGVYFIVRPYLQECCIGYSATAERDARLISKGLYDQNHEVHIVPTYDIVAAEEVHFQTVGYINNTFESSFIGDDWYSISAVDVGSIRDKAKEFHSKFYFVKVDGVICKFVPYEDLDDESAKKSRREKMVRLIDCFFA